MIWAILQRGKGTFRFVRAEPPCLKGEISLPLLWWTLCIGWSKKTVEAEHGSKVAKERRAVMRREA